MRRSAGRQRAESPSKQLASFISKFDPRIARLLQACRAALRKRLPTAIEQVYDNYNFLAIGFCTTERTSDCLVSLATSAKGVALSFYYGAALPDPEGILLGSGNQNRYLRLESASTLGTPSVAALIDAAIAQARTPLSATGRGYTMVKSVSAKQRPRRATPGPR
jgi:hypothetical protein